MLPADATCPDDGGQPSLGFIPAWWRVGNSATPVLVSGHICPWNLFGAALPSHMIYTIRGKSGNVTFSGRDVRALNEQDLARRLSTLGITDWAVIGSRQDPTNWLYMGGVAGFVILIVGVFIFRDPGVPAPAQQPVVVAKPIPVPATVVPIAPKPDPVVQCDRFDLALAGQEGDVLSVRVDTDLPSTAEAFVTVYRTYRERGSSDVYSCEYLENRHSIRDLQSGIEARITDSMWESAMRDKQRDMASKGVGFRVDPSSISGDIKVRVTVHMRQPDPAFGANNSRLVGKAVSKRGSGNVVVGATEFSRPFSGKVD